VFSTAAAAAAAAATTTTTTTKHQLLIAKGFVLLVIGKDTTLHFRYHGQQVL
jgi:hypothetical protein